MDCECLMSKYTSIAKRLNESFKNRVIVFNKSNNNHILFESVPLVFERSETRGVVARKNIKIKNVAPFRAFQLSLRSKTGRLLREIPLSQLGSTQIQKNLEIYLAGSKFAYPPIIGTQLSLQKNVFQNPPSIICTAGKFQLKNPKSGNRQKKCRRMKENA